ncbi:MAG: hypothetical protein ABJN22_08160 [Litorimonas sp.]
MKTLLSSAAVLSIMFLASPISEAKTTESVESLDADHSSGLTGSGLLIDLTSDASNVSFTFSRPADRHTDTLFRVSTLSIKGTAPIDKSSKSGVFLTDTGLSNAFSLKGSWSEVKGKVRANTLSSDEMRDLQKAAQKRCEDKKTNRDEYPAYIGRDCATSNTLVYDWKSELTLEERASVQPSISKMPLYYRGISAEIGYNEFKYYGALDLLERDIDFVPYSVSAFWGMSPSDAATYFGVGLNRKLQYTASDTLTKCPNSTGSDPTQCITGAFAKPEKDKDNSIFGVARYRSDFGLNQDNPIAVEFRTTYDFEDKVIGFAVPIYLLTNKEGQLRGGVRFKWDSDDSDFGAGIFVGTAFDLNGSG